MAMIRPSSDLRNHYNDISEFCHKTGQPVYITKNGAGDLVVLSNDDYERLTSPKAELYSKIEAGLEDERLGKVVPAKAAIERMAKELGVE